MTRPKMANLLAQLKIEVKKAADFTKKTKISAQEIAQAASASPSQSGDREHSRNQAFITQNFLNELKALLKATETEAKKEVPSKINGICYVKLNFEDGRVEEYYLTNDPVKLDKVKFISQNSPLGKILMGKRFGDSFKLTEPPVSGKVIEVG